MLFLKHFIHFEFALNLGDSRLTFHCYRYCIRKNFNKISKKCARKFLHLQTGSFTARRKTQLSDEYRT